MPLPDTDDTLLTLKVAARFKRKKKLETGTVVYEYSPLQVSRRNNEKARRIDTLRGKIGEIRKRVRKDLRSSDPETRLTALAIGLIDSTFERVGNQDSAEEGHVGVTGWQRKHLSMGKGSATFKYVGKSGVKHEKKVTDPTILKALREAYKAAKEADSCLFCWDGGQVTAQHVNEYLKPFKVTAKDLRGFHANREMHERLKAIRAKAGALPTERKERQKQLKEEFKKALEETAEAVGHEASTLKTQYLVPGLEDEFLKHGEVSEKLVKTAAYPFEPGCELDPETGEVKSLERRVLSRFLG